MALKKTVRFCSCALAGLLAVLFPSIAAAQGQTAPPQQPPTVNERVEVVATRIPESPHDVPVSVEVLTGEDLRSMGATNLQEALTLSTGVAVAPGGDNGPAGAVPEFWGLREFDAFLLVVDDVPWGGAFNPALTTLSMRDVERVEVLRGAAPVTFGATSFVGVIHVVHTRAAAGHSYAAARGGSFGSGGASIDLAIPGGGDWKSRLSADVDRQGFSDERTSFRRGHALWRTARTGDTSRTWFSADATLLRQSPASPSPRSGKTLDPSVPIDANHNPDGAFIDQNRLAVSFGFDRNVMGTAKWITIASFTHSAQNLFRGFLVDVEDVPGNAAGLREKIDVNDLYADSHFVMPAGRAVQIVAGADFLHGMGDATGATFDYTAPLAGTPVPLVTEPSTLDLRVEDRREFFGAYVMAEWKPQSRVSVSGGLRMNVTFEERGGEAEAVDAGKDKGQTHTRPSGSLGAIVTAWERGTDHVKLFGNYRNTFKPAAFDFGLGEADGGEEGLLEPETAQSYEAGVKTRTMAGRADVEASVFRIDFTNLVTATVVNGLPALMNAGETRFQGLEFGTAFHLPQHFSARASYSFHDGTFTHFTQAFDGVPTVLDGRRFEMSARHLASAGLFLAPDRGVTADVMVKYTGDRFMDKRNRALAAAFTTVDLGAGYRFDRYELRLDARNLGDRRDVVSESELGDAQYYRMTARRADLSLAVRF